MVTHPNGVSKVMRYLFHQMPDDLKGVDLIDFKRAFFRRQPAFTHIFFSFYLIFPFSVFLFTLIFFGVFIGSLKKK